jgi:hypothetical protein
MPRPKASTSSMNSMTGLARARAVQVSVEIACAWAELQYPVPDWWLVDPQEKARRAFVEQKRDLIRDGALHAVMARDWDPSSDLGAIDQAAGEIAREAAADVGAPPDTLAEPQGYQPKTVPPVGDLSSHVDQVLAAVRAVLVRAANSAEDRHGRTRASILVSTCGGLGGLTAADRDVGHLAWRPALSAGC